MMIALSLFTLFLTVAADPARLTEESYSELEARSSSLPTVYTTCKEKQTFALTFDDGPYEYEEELSKTLTSNDVVGTFFVNGNNWACIYDAESVTQLTAAYKAGNLIGQHSWSHPDLTTLSKSEITEQFTLVETALWKILGIKPRFFRPPYGSINDDVLEVAKTFGYTVITWDVDTQDGDRNGDDVPYAEKQYTNYPKYNKSKPKAGGIALNHSPYKSTVEKVAPYAIKTLKADGWKLVSVAECLGYSSSDWYKSTGKASKRDSTWTCNGTPQPGVN